MDQKKDIPPLSAILVFLSRYAPFDGMEQAHLRQLAERLTAGAYRKSEVILGPEHGEPRYFHIIMQGVVLAQQGGPGSGEREAHWELSEGECFPFGALLSRRPVVSVYRAAGDTLCLLLPAEDFREFLEISPPVQEFCTRRLASLLERSNRILQARYSSTATELQSMNSTLSGVVRRAPVSCRPATPLKAALETMNRLGIGSMVVTTEDNAPLGIFTLHDLLSRVTLGNCDLEQPISSVMTTGLFTLPPQATAYDAALAVVRHGIRHVLVVENGRLAGVVSEKDLFSLQRISMRQLSSAIRNAEDLDSLQQFSVDIRRLTQNMLTQGVAAEQLTQFIASLNDLLTQRIIDLEFAKQDLGGLRFCWMALGSEGRYEQTFSTDQDNGIIFSLPPGMTPDQARQKLLPVAARVNAALDKCGFPLCKGKIMGGNPAWCLSLGEWQQRFAHWIDSGDPEALLDGAIFFDFRHLHGEAGLAAELREWLFRHASGTPRFLHQMAENAMRCRPPLGFFRGFVVESKGEHAHTLDLKLNGATPFVDAARIYSLRCGVAHTNTAQRLRSVGPQLNVPTEELEAWVGAFLFIQLLRLRHQQLEEEKGEQMDNRINPYELNELDRLTLKEAFRLARKLQTRLALDYGL